MSAQAFCRTSAVALPSRPRGQVASGRDDVGKVPEPLEVVSVSEATVAAVEIDELTPDQARAHLEARAQREFDMTLDEFADSFERGYFSGEGEDTAAEELAFLLPLAR